MKKGIQLIIIGIVIFISQITQAQPVFNLRLVSQVNKPALDMQIIKDYAYVISKTEFYIVDISDKVNPRIIGNYSIPNVYDISGFQVIGDYAYLTVASTSGNGLYIINISNPKKLYQVSFYETSDWAKDIFIKDDHAYIADWNAGVHIVNISNPQKPFKTSIINTSCIAQNIYIKDKYLYIADYWKGLRIIDISNPSRPKQISCYCDIPGYMIEDFYIKDKYLYITDKSKGLYILDISNPKNPYYVNYYNIPGHVVGIHIKDNYAYIANTDNGLRVIDISNHNMLSEVICYNTPDKTYKVYAKDNYVYIADNSSFLILYAASVKFKITNDYYLPQGTANSYYQTELTVEGGEPPYNWSIVWGNLPKGIKINSTTGRLSGTLTQAGSFTFTIKVVDSINNITTKRLNIYVSQAPTEEVAILPQKEKERIITTWLVEINDRQITPYPYNRIIRIISKLPQIPQDTQFLKKLTSINYSSVKYSYKKLRNGKN
jgi:hypothetical protein